MALLVAAPFLLVMIAFALSNRQPVDIGLWPLDYGVQVPLSVAVLIGMAVAFLLGGLLVWGAAIGQRRRARRAEMNVRLLEEQIDGLKARLTRPAMISPALPPPS